MPKEIPEISITVNDEDEAPLQGVTVTFDSDDLEEPVVKTTGSAGGCKFNNLLEGTYTVTAELEDYDDYEEEVAFTVDSASLTITLTETEESETGENEPEESENQG